MTERYLSVYGTLVWDISQSDAPIQSFQGGERQRVKLASLLDEDVDILNFGEPTTGLHGMDVTRLLTVITDL